MIFGATFVFKISPNFAFKKILEKNEFYFKIGLEIINSKSVWNFEKCPK
jgi:hypothetical protein